MKAITQEWIAKAEDDWGSAQLAARARKHRNHNLVCFLAQQCAEKYLKASLEEAGLAFRKTHELDELLTQALTLQPAWRGLSADAKFLTDFAVAYRYPGASANQADARAALAACRRIRTTLRAAFGLPV